MSTKIIFNLHLPATVGVELDPESLNVEIQNALRDQVAYQLRDQISAAVKGWIDEELAAQKVKIMETLSPEIAKHVNSLRLSTNRH